MTELDFCLWPAIPATVVNVTGAGDSFAGGVVWGICSGWDIADCIRAGLSTAKLSVESQSAISPLVSANNVKSIMNTIVE